MNKEKRFARLALSLAAKSLHEAREMLLLAVDADSSLRESEAFVPFDIEESESRVRELLQAYE